MAGLRPRTRGCQPGDQSRRSEFGQARVASRLQVGGPVQVCFLFPPLIRGAAPMALPSP